MSENCDSLGHSVYERTPFEIRQKQILYQLVENKVLTGTKDKSTVLDVGSGDMPATHNLTKEGYSVIALDLLRSSLQKAKNRFGYHDNQPIFIQADLKHLPLSNDSLGNINTVLMLDVLEHIKETEAIEVLRNLSAVLHKNSQVFISMPIISAFSLPCIREWLMWKVKGKRPLTGLFDRTHEILTDIKGHKSIISSGGFNIIDMQIVTRRPRFNSHPKINYIIDTFFDTIIPKLIHPLNPEKRNIFRDTLDNTIFAYQGLYTLKSNNL